jgi:hypothetical protein
MLVNQEDYAGGGGGLDALYRQGQTPVTSYGSTSTNRNDFVAPTTSQSQLQGIYSPQQRDAFVNSSVPPTFFSPMSAEETAIVAAWRAKNGSGGSQGTQQPQSNPTAAQTTTAAQGHRGGTTMAQTPAWGGQGHQGTNNGGIGSNWGGTPSSWYTNTGGTTPPATTGNGGYGTNNGSGYGNQGGANSGQGNRALYDYTYYRYGDGSQHLDEVNQTQGTMNEWNAMKNSWAKPTGS